MNLTSKIPRSEQLLQEKAKYQNILKIDDETDNRLISGSKKFLEPIPETLKSTDNNCE